MNRELLSLKLLLSTTCSALALLVIDAVFGAAVTVGAVAHAFWVGALAAMTHEKISRCQSPFIERALRFSGFAGAIFFVPPLLSAGVPVNGALALRTAVSALSVGTFTVWLCYRFDPAGPGRYFSVSAKFRNR